jgi:uncharacterized protein YcaQ
VVQSAHAEPGAPGATAEALAGALAEMARWLGLERVEVSGGGDLAPALKTATVGSLTGRVAAI